MPPEPAREILLTCGIGDFIAMTSYLTEHERNGVEVIHWATRARESLLNLIPFVFPNVKTHVVVRDKWGPAFSKDYSVASRAELPDLETSIVDWSVAVLIREARSGKRLFRGSPLVTQRVCGIEHLKLPIGYFVVHPYSQTARTSFRDLTEKEWRHVHARLHAQGVPIVIVNEGETIFSPLPGVVDLTNKLTLVEAIEVIKGACGFVGAASVFSVIAAKVLPADKLCVKGHPDLKNNFSWFYYAPYNDNSFVVADINASPMMNDKPAKTERTVTINTVQGIGDLFWVYQKLAPYFDVINMNVMCLDSVGLTPLQTRAKEFCGMLPKIGEVKFKLVSSGSYQHFVRNRFGLPVVNGIPHNVCDYAVNAPLEMGINLRDIDPGSQLDEFVDLGLPTSVAKDDSLCVFATMADGAYGRWNVAQWLHAITLAARKYDTKRIDLIGADWDRGTQNKIAAGLRGYRITDYVGKLALADSISVIRKSRFFLGFQSGLNVIAENYDVPQLMVYYKKLEPMMFTWCKPASIGTTFNAMTFDDDVESVLAS